MPNKRKIAVESKTSIGNCPPNNEPGNSQPAQNPGLTAGMQSKRVFYMGCFSKEFDLLTELLCTVIELHNGSCQSKVLRLQYHTGINSREKSGSF
jgi:hypothetical protein